MLWALIAATLLVAWGAHLGARGMPSDDALITLTFAKNLARGAGFVYNHPPPVLGTTTPLFALLVAALSWVTPLTPMTSAVVLSALAWAGLPWLFFAFRRDLGLSDWQVASVAALVVAGPFARHLAMEASLFAFLLVLATALVWRGRPLAAGFATGLLFLTRGEGVLLLPVLLAALLIEDRRRRREGAARPPRSGAVALTAGFAAPVLLWAAYALPTFGEILPNTLAAKIAQGSTGLWRPFAPVLFGQWLPEWGSGLRLGGLPAANLWVAGALLGLAIMAWNRRRLLPLVVWGAAYVVGYSLLGVPAYPWYGVPVHFVLAVAFAVGLGTILDGLSRRAPRPEATGLAAVLLALVLIQLGAPMARSLASTGVNERHLAYRRLASWLADHAGPDASVAYHEIGYLGYYTDCRIVDLMGLVTSGVAEHIAAGDFAWSFWRHRPDFLVYLQGSGFETAIVTDPRFHLLYRETVRLAGYEGRTLTVFARLGGRRLPLVDRRVEAGDEGPRGDLRAPARPGAHHVIIARDGRDGRP